MKEFEERLAKIKSKEHKCTGECLHEDLSVTSTMFDQLNLFNEDQ